MEAQLWKAQVQYKTKHSVWIELRSILIRTESIMLKLKAPIN